MSRKEAWLTAALDAIAQFRATKEPLKNVVKRLGERRSLGSKERALMRDSVFSWSKCESDDVLGEMGSRLRERGIARPTLRQLDEALIIAIQDGEFSLDSESSFPEWFTKKIKEDYKKDGELLLNSLSQRAQPCLAFDPRFVEQPAIENALKNLKLDFEVSALVEGAIRVLHPAFRLTMLPDQFRRYVWIMDEGSQYAASRIQAKDGELVLDFCAGAGGKTKYLASRGAKVIAMDISEARLVKAVSRCQKEDVTYVVGDGCEPPYPENSFDHILLDAPCTGSGTIRRAPDLLSRLDEAKINEFVRLQQTLLQSACRLLRANGQLVYVTCSLFKDENVEQVTYAKNLLPLECEEYRQLLPSQDLSDGFFVASFRKTGDCDAKS